MPLFVLAIGAATATGILAERAVARAEAWQPDGAARDTAWSDKWIDLPGLSITDVHCHGLTRRAVQIGTTSPVDAQNPCYTAAEGAAPVSRAESVVSMPGDRTVVRQSFADGPWRYSIEQGLEGRAIGP